MHLHCTMMKSFFYAFEHGKQIKTNENKNKSKEEEEKKKSCNKNETTMKNKRNSRKYKKEMKL